MVFLATLVAAVVPVAQGDDIRLRKDTYHPIIETMKPRMQRASDEQLRKLRDLPMEAIWSGIRSQGHLNCAVSGLKTTRPGERLVGRARTIRCLPDRPDLRKASQELNKAGNWPNGSNVRAAEDSQPGDVLVVDLGGFVAEGIFWGDISALGAQVNGAAGAVLYGGTRDKEELEAMKGFPVLATGFDPGVNTSIGTDWNVPIRVGTVTVLPGDIVVGDSETVLFFPATIADEVIQRAEAIRDQENYERNLVREKKHRFRDVYPLNPQLRQEYERTRPPVKKP
jgi:4-hydroxy-4-methyl-2-oxoglutarate aldolase